MGFTDLQEKVIKERNGNMLVSASAGAGKTTVMIERILGLLEQGASLERMVICTFTKASASDMREKMQNALIIALAEGKKYAEEQLLKLPTAEISTIHSWCQHLIRDYFYEIDIDPAFEIADETDTAVMLLDAIDKAVEQSAQEGDEDFILLYNSLIKRHGDEKLKGLIKKLFIFVRRCVIIKG